MTASITVDGITVPLTDDRAGLVGHVDIDGVRHVIHATITATGRTVTPAKWVAGD